MRQTNQTPPTAYARPAVARLRRGAPDGLVEPGGPAAALAAGREAEEVQAVAQAEGVAGAHGHGVALHAEEGQASGFSRKKKKKKRAGGREKDGGGVGRRDELAGGMEIDE